MALSKLGIEKSCKVNKGFALVVINERYNYFKGFYRADADREKIRTICENAQFTINATRGLKTDNLTAAAMDDLFNNVAETTDFSTYDAFICFIVSYCDSEGVLGVDGGSLGFGEIIRPIIKCPSLEGKPKLFFIHNCRVYRGDTGPRSITPIEGDILVVFSGVDTNEFSVNHESLYISALTEVLNECAHYMNLTDMLAVVNRMVGSMPHFDKKQTPIFMSTLSEAVRFRNSKPEEMPKKKLRKH